MQSHNVFLVHGYKAAFSFLHNLEIFHDFIWQYQKGIEDGGGAEPISPLLW